MKITVACLGSSSTAGRGQAFDWIGELARAPRNREICFRNYGVGGDLAYNALKRLPDVLAARPNKVVVLIGGNDVLAAVSRKARCFFQLSKRLPRQPSSDWYRENMVAIARNLKRGRPERVAFCSLIVIGEDPDSTDPFQRSLNQCTEEYSAIIKDVALSENLNYLPVYENMRAQIGAAPRRALTSFRFLLFYRDAFRALVLQKDSDEIARMNGWRFHSDGVHLNSHGGRILAELVQDFIDN